MTDSDLTDGEKLNLILAKLSDMETRLAKLEAQKKKGPRSDCDSHSDVWLDYRDTAEMMRCPKAYFRERWADGSYKYWPDIERWQPGGCGTRLYVRREHVEAWIERSPTPPAAPAPIKQQFNGIGYECALPGLRRLGAVRVIRGFGLERYIPGEAKREKKEEPRVSTKAAKKEAAK